MAAQQLPIGKRPDRQGIAGGIAQVRPAGPVPGVGQTAAPAQPILQRIPLTSWRQRHHGGQVEGIQPWPAHGRALPCECQVTLSQLVQKAQGLAQVLCGAGKVLAGLWPTLLQLREHFTAQVVARELRISV
ncbi:hypothetical protein D3C80_1570830 [compost metagenome]